MAERPNLDAIYHDIQRLRFEVGHDSGARLMPFLGQVELLFADNARLAAELAGAQEALRSLERVPFEGHPEWLYCGVCGMWMNDHPKAGHAEDCALVSLLARLEGGA